MKVNQHIKNTALFHALEQNNSDMVKTALAAGANVNAKNLGKIDLMKKGLHPRLRRGFLFLNPDPAKH